MVVTLAIIGILSWLAIDSFRRVKPAATHDSVSAELQSLVHFARQQALATGRGYAVLVFPDLRTAQGTGRIVVLKDEPVGSPKPSFFAADGGYVNYNPSNPATTTSGALVETFDLPDGVLVGPENGNGQETGIPFPYNSIDTDVRCSFCAKTGDHSGGILFDGRGRVSFYSWAGNALAPSGQAAGASLTIYSPEAVAGVLGGSPYHTSTLVVTAPAGTVRTFWHGEDKR